MPKRPSEPFSSEERALKINRSDVSEAFSGLTEITDQDGKSPLGDSHRCLVGTTGELPQIVLDRAFRLARNLCQEARYDRSTFSETHTSGKKCRLFFIMNNKLDESCGVFILREESSDKYTNFLEGIRSLYSDLSRKWQPDKETEQVFFQRKITNNVTKLTEADKKKVSLVDHTLGTPESNRYSIKSTNYNLAELFFKAKDRIASNAAKLPATLTTAYIIPKCRKLGLLRRLWPFMQEKYQLIEVDHPSSAMTSFIEAQPNLAYFENYSRQGRFTITI